MDKKEFLDLDFKAMPRIPIKAIWIAGMMINHLLDSMSGIP